MSSFCSSDGSQSNRCNRTTYCQLIRCKRSHRTMAYHGICEVKQKLRLPTSQLPDNFNLPANETPQNHMLTTKMLPTNEILQKLKLPTRQMPQNYYKISQPIRCNEPRYHQTLQKYQTTKNHHQMKSIGSGSCLEVWDNVKRPDPIACILKFIVCCITLH